MKRIYVNLKRFDIPPQLGGVNRISLSTDWSKTIVQGVQEELKEHSDDAKFEMFFPEAHIMSAIGALSEDSTLCIGSQGVYRQDTAVGGNFGAFTTNRTANSMKILGCTSTIIGHCEERNDKKNIIERAGADNFSVVNEILNEEILVAQNAGLEVLYCIGETSEEQQSWEKVLGEQLEVGLANVDRSKVTIAYEPVWSIGPGKTPADRDYIIKISEFVKRQTGGLPVVYGGGLKKENAEMLASIDTIDGGLIALTRFSGEIGFYPEEYLEIVKLYLKK